MKEIKVSTKEMFRGSLYTFYRDTVSIDNVETTRDVIKLNNYLGAVQVLCIDEFDRVIAVKQYRHVAKKYVMSCVGGYIELNESPLDAAVREVEEEIGGEIIDIVQVGCYWPLVAYSYEKSFHFVAKIKCELKDQNLDTFEDIEVVKISYDEFYKYVNSEQCMSLNSKLIMNYYQMFLKKLV